MKQAKNKIITTLLAVIMAFSLTACTSQADIDNAVNPVTEQITQIDGYIDTLESKVETLENSLTTINTALETLEENSATKTALLETKTALESEITAIKADIQALKDKDSAFASELSALDGRLTTLETTISALSTTVNELKTQVEEIKTKIEQIEQENAELKDKINTLNCLHDIHELGDCSTDGNGTHNGVCIHCEQEITENCVYGETVSNENGSQSKTCSICTHTSVTFSKIWADSLTLDLSALLNITDETTVYMLISTPFTGYGSIDGVTLSCPLKGDYIINVTINEVLTHTLTVSIINNPATDDFNGEWTR